MELKTKVNAEDGRQDIVDLLDPQVSALAVEIGTDLKLPGWNNPT